MISGIGSIEQARSFSPRDGSSGSNGTRGGFDDLPESFWDRVDEGGSWASKDGASSLVNLAVEKWLSSVHNEDVDRSVDVGDDAVVEWQSEGERTATSHHLASESRGIDTTWDSGRLEGELGTGDRNSRVRDLESRVGGDSQVAPRDETTSDGENLAGTESDIECRRNGGRTVENVEQTLVTSLDGHDGSRSH